MSRRRRGLRRSDRAVSEVVGYVLVFSLIIATVGVVTTVGFGTLDDRQSAERINNVERAFDVFATNVEDVYRKGAPSRATEMRLAGGTVEYGESVNITVQNASDSNVNHTIETTPLVYSEGDSEVVYVAGAIIRVDGDNSVMLREPPFVLDRNRTLLPFVRTTRAVGPGGVTRDGTVRIESRQTHVNVTTDSDLADADELELVVDSPREDAWDQYLSAQAEQVGGDYHAENGTLEFESEEVTVPRFRLRLRFIT